MKIKIKIKMNIAFAGHNLLVCFWRIQLPSNLPNNQSEQKYHKNGKSIAVPMHINIYICTYIHSLMYVCVHGLNAK